MCWENDSDKPRDVMHKSKSSIWVEKDLKPLESETKLVYSLAFLASGCSGWFLTSVLFVEWIKTTENSCLRSTRIHGSFEFFGCWKHGPTINCKTINVAVSQETFLSMLSFANWFSLPRIFNNLHHFMFGSITPCRGDVSAKADFVAKTFSVVNAQPKKWWFSDLSEAALLVFDELFLGGRTNHDRNQVSKGRPLSRLKCREKWILIGSG